ncbi:MAG: hypothetical protein A3I63_03325 [Betaproteobacteria bacterium RIFCSPLOWO2_02_FULL_66_14]|nr:MAG: hypothetical protein A3I63_03325 [Betaproteobacteria bacterium RIFCSPLOWO2_02_FULL_66_14]
MKTWLIAVAIVALAACGVETASTAATAASIKQRELEEGKKAQDRAQQKIDQAKEIMQQRANQAGGDATR